MGDRSMKVAASALAIALGLAGVGAIGFAEGAIAQSMPDRKKEADRLLQHGIQQGRSGVQRKQKSDYETSLQYIEQALKLYRQIQDHSGEARSLSYLGAAYLGLDDIRKAIEISQQAVALAKKIQSPELEQLTIKGLRIAQQQAKATPQTSPQVSRLYIYLLKQGSQQYESGEFEDAIQTWEHLPNLSSSSFFSKEFSLGLLGNAYLALNRYGKAIEYHEKAVTIASKRSNLLGEGRSSSSLGSAYFYMGDYTKSIKYYERYLEIMQYFKAQVKQGTAVGNLGLDYPQGEGIALSNLGMAHQSLGNYDAAIDYHEQSLASTRERKDLPGEGKMLVDIGDLYQALGHYKKAIEYYEQSLEIARKLKDKSSEGVAMGNLAVSYLIVGDNTKVIEYEEKSLAALRESKDRQNEVMILGMFGRAYYILGNYSKAIEFHQHSLSIERELKDRRGEGITLSNFGYRLAQQQPILAVVFFKQAINVHESIRQDIRTLPRETQEIYTSSIALIYRMLADSLLTQGRIREAQSILELLKVQEAQGYEKDQEKNTLPIQLPLHPLESQALQAFEKSIASKSLTLESLNTIGQPLTQNRDRITQDMNAMPIAIGNPQGVLNANPNALLIQNLVVGDKLWVLWTNASGNTKAIVVPNVTQNELTTTVEIFRKQIGSPYSNLNELKATSQKLHNWLIPPELQAELKNNPKPQLLFSLDHVTRYIPVAALYDGTQYLAQRYTLSNLITMDSDMGDRLSQNGQSPSILGLGTSKRYDGFSALENVPAELRAIVQDGTTKGIYPGKIQLNEAFTAKTLTENLNAFRVLHIATHGSFNPKTINASYLLLGNGDKLPITDIASLNSLTNTHLVVLSACETGISGLGQDGTEISGISGYFLRRGAKSVLASLWSVNDASTSLLMQQFYQNLSRKTMTKAQALQQSQQDFINGKLTPTDALKLRNEDFVANIPAALRSPRTIDYTHPFFWAPFTLTGNNQ
jgi:CHAT domain-containing protein